MSMKQPSEKQKAYWDRMNESGGWKLLGKAGGQANVAKYGSEHMADLGRLGGLKLIDNLGGREAAREYFSRIARIKGKKEDRT